MMFDWLFGGLIIIVGTAQALRCVWLVYRGMIAPVLASWLVFMLAVSLSFFSGIVAQIGNLSWRENILGNFLNLADLFLTCIIFFSVLAFSRGSREFNSFDRRCLTLVVFILVLWAMTKNPVAANIFFQTVLVIGYLPTFVRLYRAAKQTESFFMWSSAVCISALSLYFPIAHGNVLGILYPLRSLVCTSLVLFLMFRIKRRA